MRIALLLPIALLLGAVTPATAPLNESEFQQLMKAAVDAASRPSELQPLTSTICVKRDLGPALDFEKHLGASHLPVGIPEVDRSLDAAISATGAATRQTRIPKLPRRYSLVDSDTLPPQCIIQHTLGRGPNWKHNESIVVLTFARPAWANGYAFIEQSEECAGLCGKVFLRVFRKQNGKWSQAVRTILAVS